MKKISRTISAFILGAVLVAGFAVNAQETVDTEKGTVVTPVLTPPPSQIPIKDLETLKAYALTRVDSIHGYVYGDSVYGNYWFNVPYTNHDADFERMSYVASCQAIKFKADPMERLESSLNYNGMFVLSDENGNSSTCSFSLFYGWKQFYLENGKGGWQVPQDAYNISLMLSDWIPFPISGITGAYMQLTDDYGNVTGYLNLEEMGRLNRDFGFIYLGRELLNRNGEMNISLKDGTKLVYGLREGKLRESVEVFTTGFRGKIEGTRSVEVNQAVIRYQEQDGLIRASYTKDTDVVISFPVELNVYPVVVHVIDLATFAADPTVQWRSFNPWKEPVKFKGAAGTVILIRFEYPVQQVGKG